MHSKISRIASSILFVCAATVSIGFAEQFPGAVLTTEITGAASNQNLKYGDPADVYINGGPQNQTSPGLPDGTYYFQVTDSDGEKLLSTDNAVCRQLMVVNGRIAGATGPCPHSNGTLNPSNHSTPVQLAPFLTTSDSGGAYKAWLIRQTGSSSISSSNPRVIRFSNSNSKSDDFKLMSSSAAPAGSCQPANSISVLVSGKNVVSYVPNGSWQRTVQGITMVKVEGDTAGTTQTIPTREAANSCASNSRTGQTVCTSNNNDVYVISGTTIKRTLTTTAAPAAVFLGGTCATCGVTMDATHDRAVIGLNITPAVAGYQILNLDSSTLEPPFPSQAPGFTRISEAILLDPVRSWILSPNENSNYEIVKLTNKKAKEGDRDDDNNGDKREKKKGDAKNDDDKTGGNKKKDDNNNGRGGNNGNDDDRDDGKTEATRPSFFENAIEPFAEFASAGEDCATGIALAIKIRNPFDPTDVNSQVYLFDLTRPTFTPGSPSGTWSATYKPFILTDSVIAPYGPSGVAIAQGTHTGLVTGITSDTITAIMLPSTSGTLAMRDWVSCRVPFLTGLAPHAVSAYRSPNDGHAHALIDDLSASNLAVIDLTEMLKLPRTANGHTCASGFLPSPVIRNIAMP